MGQKKKTAEEEKLENDFVKNKRDDWSRLLSQQNKCKLQDDDSNNDNDTLNRDGINENEQLSFSRSQAFTTPVPRRVQQLCLQLNFQSSSSRATPESEATLTAAKQAKLETASTSIAIGKIIDAVTVMVNDWQARTSSGNETFLIYLKKLEDEANEAKKARQLQAKQMTQILSIIQNLKKSDK